MNWKYEAIDKLKSYELKKNSLTAIPEQITELESEFGSIRSSTSDSEPVHGSGGRSEDALINNISKREELKKAFEITSQAVRNIERAFSLLNEEERALLESFYVRPVKDVVITMCDKMGCEQATVYRRRNDALRKFTLALYGAVEL